MLQSFRKTWNGLFQDQSHLDSLLSKVKAPEKGVIAESIRLILTAPVSLTGSSPWRLAPEALVDWEPALDAFQELARLGEAQLTKLSPESGLEDFPPELTEAWERDWGLSAAERLADALTRRAPTTVRISRRLSLQEAQRGLPGFSPCEYSPIGLTAPGYRPVHKSKPYLDGNLEIQDEGSQLLSWLCFHPEHAPLLLKDRPSDIQETPPEALALKRIPAGLNVTDTCAGAGGKSLCVADLMLGKGRVFAYDISETKLKALKRRASRAGLRNIHALPLKLGRESESTRDFNGRSDLVIVDAPCSGHGVLRRNPDIKWPRQKRFGVPFPELQRRLLSTFSGLARPEGRLLYMTCTFSKDETLDVVEAFVDQHPDFRVEFSGFIGPHPMDGFFIASFLKTR